VELSFEMPLTEIVFDFYDKLKSQTRGYASFDYHPMDYRESDIVKMDILLNNEKVDALSALIHRSRAQDFGRKLCEKLKGASAAPAIPDRHPGSHRRQGHLPRNHLRDAQGRDRQVLRW
jgi:translation elongation factor EF-4